MCDFQKFWHQCIALDNSTKFDTTNHNMEIMSSMNRCQPITSWEVASQ